ncbi:tRNA uridine-5-carboxymethylaminomethyl(34) synthesis GTPase MnmE [Candidatus Nitrotoga sp. M5]|uniref:tRNA uridine-5-carboxymethylaminomethyl(34) synthesis GTPase MnmE n=1 Tax=Candidatus Nitrotoga sp. M5 TaxID=2890409 RepID=UPI001EF1EDD7|nr:tRNA uridine-5-carboxymethylaminomethyl(34) synthesis GTPase MnmE [Candidatus Nitrotoga sp. M5]CAH1385669.1 5-carboxymethylaminomethyluridine-tRNA synthase GTPase subunit [Candidatus Nitrotoga sp. M5]
MSKALLKPDVIAAIATPHGQGGIGVVRLSGPDLSLLAQTLIGKVPVPRHATYASFLDEHGQVMDQGIALFFPAPHSYTGEDTLELQGHGGTAILQLVLHRCLEIGARFAQPGEFTQRAFLNEKLDLAQAESVADLIAATTSQAARSAMRSLQGEFSQAIHHLVSGLVSLRMLVEAMLDFPEEEIDTPDVAQRDARLDALRKELENILSLAQQGSLLREGAHIVLVGQPNVGKSSLLNKLSGEDVALVSEFPGTTRDLIRQSIQINGVPLHIIDTAGLHEAEDAVEQMGIARTYGALNKADAILVLLDAIHGMTKNDQKILDELPLEIPRLHVFNKVDLLNHQHAYISEDNGECHIYLSAKTGEGLELLRNKLLSMLGWHQEAGIFMARERHIHALLDARNHLQKAEGEIKRPELCAEELRLAQEGLNSITGKFSADDLLGEIFSRFCIGK